MGQVLEGKGGIERQLKTYFKCDELFTTLRPIITDGQWRYFRDLYNRYEAGQGTDDGDRSYKLARVPFDSPVEGALTASKGRGLVSVRNLC